MLKKRLLSLLIATLLITSPSAQSADDIIVPANQGKAYLKDNAGNLFPASVVYTTDGNGNVVPVTSVIGAITIGTVDQGIKNGGGAASWPVRDDHWSTDFDVWKTWADVNLSTRASESTLSALNTKIVITANGVKVDGSAVTQPVSGTVAVSNFPATQPVSGSVNVGNFPSTQTVTGSISVSNFPGTQPVSGTIAATQSGTWTVQPGNTPNTTPWLATISQGGNSATVSAGGALKVDNSAVTQPVSAASLPLPSGAATAANQATANTTLSTISGQLPSALVSGRLTVDGSGVTQPVSGTVNAAQTGTWQTRTLDVSGNGITSQLSGAQRALDIGVNVSGVQVDPRSIRALTSTDVVTANIKDSAGASITLNQKAMVNSFPVVIASDQSAIPVSQSGNFTIQPLTNSSIVKAQLQDNAGTAITLGQKVLASSVPVAIASDQGTLTASLGNSVGKANVMVPGTLTSTAVTANQVVTTYTVTAGKTLYLLNWDVNVQRTTFSTTAADYGTCSLESPAATKLWTMEFSGAGFAQWDKHISEPIPIPASTVVRIVCTPGATTSTLWDANLIGYEK